eukprot:scaffold285512_cov40-Prasinocladus_malaysianus.AAC.1
MPAAGDRVCVESLMSKDRSLQNHEAAHCNDMAVWSLKALMQHTKACQAVLEAGGLQALVSLLRHPSASASALEAATWALKALTDTQSSQPAPTGGLVSDLLARGGVEALLGSIITSANASDLSKEGALRVLWNLAYCDRRVVDYLSKLSSMKSLYEVLANEASLEVRGVRALIANKPPMQKLMGSRTAHIHRVLRRPLLDCYGTFWAQEEPRKPRWPRGLACL